jgi:hypothetical protein
MSWDRSEGGNEAEEKSDVRREARWRGSSALSDGRDVGVLRKTVER